MLSQWILQATSPDLAWQRLESLLEMGWQAKFPGWASDSQHYFSGPVQKVLWPPYTGKYCVKQSICTLPWSEIIFHLRRVS
jgi:hypothetical protein